VLAAFVPIRALTVLGDRAELVLGRLVFHVAVPAVLFTTLSRTPVSRLLTPALGLDGHLLSMIALSGVTAFTHA
jgi:predicted permease